MAKSKACNALVTSDECRGNHEKMIRKFLKKVKKSGIIEEYREREYYVKPSEKKRKAKLRAIKAQKKAQQKRNEELLKQERDR